MCACVVTQHWLAVCVCVVIWHWLAVCVCVVIWHWLVVCVFLCMCGDLALVGSVCVYVWWHSNGCQCVCECGDPALVASVCECGDSTGWQCVWVWWQYWLAVCVCVCVCGDSTGWQCVYMCMCVYVCLIRSFVQTYILLCWVDQRWSNSYDTWFSRFPPQIFFLWFEEVALLNVAQKWLKQGSRNKSPTGSSTKVCA